MEMKLITFDFWNTLFLDTGEPERNRKRLSFAFERLKRRNQSLEVEKLEQAFEVANEFFNRQWYELKACTMDQHFQCLENHLQMKLPIEERAEIVDYFETILLEYPPVLVQNAAESVQLASSGRKVGMISDAGHSPGRTLRKLLEKHEIYDAFHSFSFSNETGFLKPSPECFWRILNELDVKPEEAVHIGDLEETDVMGAKRIGMKAIKYVGSNPSSSRKSIADSVIDDLSELPQVISSLKF
jgi:putative hydrolase of the HAD superfamily